MNAGPPPTLVLRDARLADGRPVDVDIAGERIVAVRDAGSDGPDGAEMLDCAGGLLSPCFVEGHIHLDKTLLGLPLIPHRPGATVAERIATERLCERRCRSRSRSVAAGSSSRSLPSGRACCALTWITTRRSASPGSKRSCG